MFRALNAGASQHLQQAIESLRLLRGVWIVRIAGVGEVGIDRFDAQPWSGANQLNGPRQLGFHDSHAPHSGIQLQVNHHVTLSCDAADALQLFRANDTDGDVVVERVGNLRLRQRAEHQERQRDPRGPQLERLFEQRGGDHGHAIGRAAPGQLHRAVTVSVSFQDGDQL